MFADPRTVDVREWTRCLHGVTPELLGARTLDASLCLVTDALALAYAGNRSPGMAGVLGYVRTQTTAPGYGVVAPWLGGEVTSEAAALVTGALIHAWDYDDTFDTAGLHSSACVVASAFAASAHSRPSRPRLLAAIALGCEVAAGLAVSLGITHRMHLVTCAAGAVAAAFTASYVQGLSAEQTWEAMGIAFSSSLAPRQPVAEGALTKRLQPGLAAAAGVRAAGLAAHGVTGAAGWWDGSFGLARIWEHDVPAGFADSRSVVEAPVIARLAMKPYACCRLVHSTLDAGRSLWERGAWQPCAVDSIQIHLPAEASYDIVARQWSCVGETFTARQFSASWTLALMLLHGEVSVRTLELTMDSHEVCELASAMRIHRDLAAPNGMGPATVALFGAAASVEQHVASPSGVSAYLDASIVRAKARSVCGDAFARLDTFISELARPIDAAWDANAAIASLAPDNYSNSFYSNERGT